MPNPIKDLIKKRKKEGSWDYESNREILSYNEALSDLANDPTFLKSLEDGLVERVGNDIKPPEDGRTLMGEKADYWRGVNTEKEITRDIIHSYFNPETEEVDTNLRKLEMKPINETGYKGLNPEK